MTLKQKTMKKANENPITLEELKKFEGKKATALVKHYSHHTHLTEVTGIVKNVSDTLMLCCNEAYDASDIYHIEPSLIN